MVVPSKVVRDRPNTTHQIDGGAAQGFRMLPKSQLIKNKYDLKPVFSGSATESQ